MEPTQTQLDFREGMSRLGAAVTLITSDGPAGRHGLIASAVCSVTDTPPMLLVCVNRSAYVHDKFLLNNHVCINVLSAAHQDLSKTFAHYAEGVDRFASADFTTGETGCPVLTNANAAFDCRIASRIEQGSHTVMFCEVLSVHLREHSARGLVYFSRDYHHLEAKAFPLRPAGSS